MVARMCELAGIDAVWVRDGLVAPSEAALDAWVALLLAAAETRRVRLGAMLDVTARGLDALQDLLREASQRPDLGGRLEITLCGEWQSAVALLESARLPRESAFPAPVIGLEVVHGPDDAETAVRLADDVLLPMRTGPGQQDPGQRDPGQQDPGQRDPGQRDLGRRDLGQTDTGQRDLGQRDLGLQDPGLQDVADRVATLMAACGARGREFASLGVAVQLPVSVGRTETEAQARAAPESLFAGDRHPAVSGIFGTLEMCQDRVIELAHAGVTDVRCVLPNSPDVHDVIAQLTAMVVGSIDVLQPGAPRSRAPDAPSAWGGRPRFPSA